MAILWCEFFPESVEIVTLPQQKQLKYMMELSPAITSLRICRVFLCSVGMFSRGCYSWVDITRCKVRDSVGMCVPYKQQKEKGLLVSFDVVNASEGEFLFSAKKLLFFGMRQFRFLSEAFSETVTFGFIYLFLFLLCFF